MKVFTLLGGYDYEGSNLLGVFESAEQLLQYVQSKTWYYDSMGYVESKLGVPCTDDDMIQISVPRRIDHGDRG